MCNTNIARVPWTPDMSMDRIVIAHALSIVGVGADNPSTRGTFLGLLGMPPTGGRWDIDRPYRCVRGPGERYITQGLSTCGLVVTGLWRRVGVDAPWPHEPYRIGTAIRRIVAFAHATKWATACRRTSYDRDRCRRRCCHVDSRRWMVGRSVRVVGSAYVYVVGGGLPVARIALRCRAGWTLCFCRTVTMS